LGGLAPFFLACPFLAPDLERRPPPGVPVMAFSTRQCSAKIRCQLARDRLPDVQPVAVPAPKVGSHDQDDRPSSQPAVFHLSDLKPRSYPNEPLDSSKNALYAAIRACPAAPRGQSASGAGTRPSRKSCVSKSDRCRDWVAVRPARERVSKLGPRMMCLQPLELMLRSLAGVLPAREHVISLYLRERIGFCASREASGHR